MGKEHLWRTAAVNSIVLEELRELGEAFSQPPPIPAVVLKGGALAFTLYPDLSFRPLSDLDILVPEECLEEAVARVQALGYREASPEVFPGQRKGLEFHCKFAKEGLPITLELHWGLAASRRSRYAPDMAWFWAHAEPLPLPFPSPFLTLDPTAHLLYLTFHAMFEHGEAELDPKWLYDIHLLVEREGERIDWEELAGKAIAFRWAEATARAFERCSALFGTRFPDGVLQLLKEGGDEGALRILERRALPRRKGEKAWDAFWTLDWRGRLSLGRSILFPSPAFVRWRYQPRPQWLWPLFYLYRWFDIAREGVYLLARRARPGLLIALGFLAGMLLAWLLWPPRIALTWKTASEVDAVGFFIYRADSPQGPFVRVNEVPIPALGDALAGASYSYEDRDVAWGRVYFYQLEELERSGNRRRYPQVVKGQAGVGWPGALAMGVLAGALAWGASRWKRSRS